MAEQLDSGTESETILPAFDVGIVPFVLQCLAQGLGGLVGKPEPHERFTEGIRPYGPQLESDLNLDGNFHEAGPGLELGSRLAVNDIPQGGTLHLVEEGRLEGERAEWNLHRDTDMVEGHRFRIEIPDIGGR